MNFKRILSSALMVVMLFTTIATFIPTKAEAAFSQSVETESTKTPDEIKNIVLDSYEYGSGDFAWKNVGELLDYEMEQGYLDYVTSPGNKYTLYVNRYTGVFYYENNLTGEILTSNPYNVSEVPAGKAPPSIDTRMLLMSQIQINFFESANTTKVSQYVSAQWAAEKAQLTVSPIAGGLRVNYTLGDTAARFLIPGQIVSEKFEKNLLTPMVNKFAELLKEYLGEKYPDMEFDFFKQDKWGKNDTYVNGCVNQQALREYCKVMQNLYKKEFGRNDKRTGILDNVRNDILKFVLKYTLYNPVNENNQGKLENMYKEAPKTKDGVAVYVFKDKNATDKKVYSAIVREYCPDYTFQNMYDDEAECGFVYERVQNPIFRCSLEYTFNEDGSLSVRLPANSISFDETVYTLVNITPLAYFGAGNINEDGYVFIPDGSGSVIDYEDFRTQNVSLELGMYGKDYCYSQITGAHREPVTMPVYGVTTVNNATPYTKSLTGKDRVNAGYFAIIEEGSSLASLKVNFGGLQHKYATAYSTFTPYPSDKFDLSDTITVGGVKEYTIVSESKYTGSYITRYVMLSDETVQAKTGAPIIVPPTYSGMAKYYREYLKAKGQLSELENISEILPLYIEALGSMEIIKKILTFPVSSAIPLTTFDDVYTMYTELANAKEKFLKKAEEYDKLAAEEEKNQDQKQIYLDKAESYRTLAKEIYDVKNINFKLTGFSNGGMYFKYPTKVKWEKSCGGNKGFENLIENVAKVNEDATKHFGVYPEFDFMYISNSAMFDGVSPKKNVSRMVDNRYASKKVYNSVLSEYEELEDMVSLIISSDTLDDLYTKFDKKYDKFGHKSISLSTMGSDINSNFDEDNPINREESRKNVMDVLDRIANENEYSVMVNVGNIYSVKYADHVIDICTDSSHFRYASYSVPFIGMVLHSYVNYAGGAFNYSGSPKYDMLHAIENGASLYYILCYQNTNFLKDDEHLNEYYGVNYENWFDKVVEQYSILNKAIGDLQSYEIVDHRTLIAERVIDKSETETNNRLLREEFIGLIKEQLNIKINNAFDEMFGDPANNGRGVKLVIDTETLMNQASDVLNISVADLIGSGFKAELDKLVAGYTTEYPGTGTNPYVVELKTIEYTSEYKYVTDSKATDKDYVKTDYTVDNNLVTIVTYRDAKTGDTVKFLLNYNIYSVTIRLDDNHTYTLGKYDFIRIDD